ncbi:hypothetical protein SEVIR_5G126200v4 [Setaria viridis]|uniref:Uncharacterized protein n=1 Tax=Setaria viridis TaxID=4556 RepID=A0A4U6UI11_SETVI|nr:hypothetical protein SEVIR_5G126200v2 [Setaria viridis]
MIAKSSRPRPHLRSPPRRGASSLLAPSTSVYQLAVAPLVHDSGSNKSPLPLLPHGSQQPAACSARAAATAPVHPLVPPLPHRLPTRIRARASPRPGSIMPQAH